MSKITLNVRELKDIMDMFNKINEPMWSAEYETITLEQSNENGIGSILKATMYIKHKDIEGEFAVTITDESNW